MNLFCLRKLVCSASIRYRIDKLVLNDGSVQISRLSYHQPYLIIAIPATIIKNKLENAYFKLIWMKHSHQNKTGLCFSGTWKNINILQMFCLLTKMQILEKHFSIVKATILPYLWYIRFNVKITFGKQFSWNEYKRKYSVYMCFVG